MAHQDPQTDNLPAYDPDGPALCMPVLDRLLLGIINANPLEEGDTRSPKQRLNAALKALVGRTASPLIHEGQDLEWLTWMGIESRRDKYLRWRYCRRIECGEQPSEPEPLVRTAHQLSISATEKRVGRQAADFTESDVATKKRLYDKFTGSYYVKQRRRGKSTDWRGTWEYFGEEHDYILETIEQQTLEKLAALLGQSGVRVNLPDP